MTDFHSSRTVKARKEHRCEHCYKPIAVGEQYYRCAQVFEGDFHSFNEHIDCHKAWQTVNFSKECRDFYPSEGAMFLGEDEFEDDERVWMRANFPTVAERLGWSA